MNQRPAFGYNPARVLIVDDERNNRELLKFLLAPKGFVLSTANDGEDAMTQIATEAPDLILLDVMMPGLDGFGVTEKLKANPATRNIPIIMVTALDDNESRIRGLDAGAEDFLSRPVNHAELAVKVRNLLRLKAYGEYYDHYSQMLESEVASRTSELAVRTEQAATLTEQAALIDLAQDAIVVRDMQGRILSWSRGAESLYGWSGDEALGRNMHELLRTTFSEPADRMDAVLFATGHWEGEAIQYTRVGGRLVVATRWALQPDADGVPARVLTISNDITQRHEAEAALHLLTERLSLATSVAEVGVWDWDLVSNTLTWDATMSEIYGLPCVVPMAYGVWAASVHPADLPAAEAVFRRAIDECGRAAVEFRTVRPDGSIRAISAIGRAVVDVDGIARRMIGVNLDITIRKQAEADRDRLRAEQLQFKDDFLSHVSHELRSPLTAIKQFASILSDGLAGELNAEQEQYQQIILRNARLLQSMIDDLLEVTRLETGKLSIEPEPLSIAEAVGDVFHTLEVTARDKGVTLVRHLAPDLPTVYADHTRLRQILIILFDNAIKFTPAGGTVTIRAHVSEQNCGLVQVEVCDTGCGVDPEVGELVFDRLYQVADHERAGRQGLGLGLHICKSLVVLQGGAIWIDREQRVGSTFAFTVPVCSLRNVIAPVFRHGSWPSHSVALLALDWKSEDVLVRPGARREMLSKARRLVCECLDPAQEALLPATLTGGAAEHLLLAAFVDEPGARVLADKLRNQLKDLTPTCPADNWSVTYSMRPKCIEDPAATSEEVITRTARHLEDWIPSHVTQGAASDEQQAHSDC